MKITVSDTPKKLGEEAAVVIAQKINEAIKKQGYARIVLSTGASQFETIEALIKEDVEWDKVTMFHLDEYVDLEESHIASFRKYLKERFVSKVPLKAAYFVNGEGNVEENISQLTTKLRELPIDVGVIGIGENGHIAFNDPPADFETDLAYKVVDLDDRCKQQQVGEGWFKTLNDVPKQAITMCVKQILSCNTIVTCVPHSVKAQAIKNTLTMKVTENVPATILKTHKDWNLFIDKESAKDVFSL
jgi:glucosamine-6-phosphate deaminase